MNEMKNVYTFRYSHKKRKEEEEEEGV